MIFEILAVGLLISVMLALFLDEVVYSVAALAGTFLFTALIYYLDGAVYGAIFQFVVGIGTLAVLFLSGEMLGDKPVKKTSPARFGVLVGVGVLLSLPAIFISISGPAGIPSDLTLGDALWNVRGLDVVLQAIVVFTIALGIGIVLYQKNRKGRA